MGCHICGREVSPDDLRCRFCHAKLRDDPVAGQPLAYGRQSAMARTYGVRGVGIAAIVAVAATILFDTLGSAWPVVGRRLAVRAMANEDPALLNMAGIAQMLLAIAWTLAYLIAGTLVIIWFFRARKNLDALDGYHFPRRGAGWAIGGWFVPIGNLYIPCQMMADIARASLARVTTPWLVGVWWASWLIYLTIGQIAGMLDIERSGELPAELATPADYQRYLDYYDQTLLTFLPGMLPGIVAAVALITLIRRISAAQTARIRGDQPVGPVLPGMAVPSPQVPAWRDGTIGA